MSLLRNSRSLRQPPPTLVAPRPTRTTGTSRLVTPPRSAVRLKSQPKYVAMRRTQNPSTSTGTNAVPVRLQQAESNNEEGSDSGGTNFAEPSQPMVW